MERILVVDDDPSITEAFAKVLGALGYSVICHTDPREAVKETQFDLIVTDFNMPFMSGIELLRQVRASVPKAVRLLMTAVSDFRVAMQAVNEGEVFRLIAKPWQLSELRAAIEQSVQYFRLVEENRRMAREIAERNATLLELNANLEAQVIERTNGLLEGMIRALDYRDTETQWHSWRVARYTKRLAEAAGIKGEELKHIEQGALLHDIGKIGVRDAILLKPGPLTPDEWIEMRKHPDFGRLMLAKIPYLKEAAAVVYQHQERWDGKGYPQQLKGTDICIGARLFCIADTLDAITSDRPYRKGATLEVAISEIGRLGGTQFDPELAKIFVGIDSSEWVKIRKEIEQLEHAEEALKAKQN
jgi:response regulator RpfG family c-di-GMP phosphodiesterase